VQSKTKNLILGIVLFVTVLAGSLAVASVTSEEVVTAFDNAGILLGLPLACAAIVGVVLGLWKTSAVRRFLDRWLRPLQFARAGEVVRDFEMHVDAAVIPVGTRSIQAEWIIRHLKPKCVSLLFTPGSRDAAAKLAEKLEAEVKFDPSQREIAGTAMLLEDLLDLKEAREMARYYLDRFLRRGFQRERIIVDTTGGTTPMSMGLLQAAEEMRISSIYVVGRMSEGDQKGWILDAQDPNQAEPRFMSDHTHSKVEEHREIRGRAGESSPGP